MPTVGQLVAVLEQLAPPQLAESWDNVGLLVGDRGRPVRRVMTCLTLTPTSVAEAIDGQADLVISHHPLPFRPLSQITTDSTVGRLLWELIGARVSVYSPHTALDSARGGINERLAAGLGLAQIQPLTMIASVAADTELGAGRCGVLDTRLTLAGLADRVKSFLAVESVRVVGAETQTVERVAVACGSGASLLAAACDQACDCLVTGEASFHTCLEADARGIGLILAGHFASERFALIHLANELQQQLDGVSVWASERECDPLHIL